MRVDITSELKERIDMLAKKYYSSGQDLLAYLDGLLYADYTTYWDYIHLDTLLSLQTPRTNIPDEEIFIMYHQITELYFKLSLHKIKQIEELKNRKELTADILKIEMQRLNRYFIALTHSFGVMEKGMDREQFLKFRMSLVPASGFQSVQYRMIEISATDFINLVNRETREYLRNKKASIEEMYPYIYWKKGATLADSGDKTLTLKQFEEKYTENLIRLAKKSQEGNLWQIYQSLTEEEKSDKNLIEVYRSFDLNVNVNWSLQHYRTSVAYLAQHPHDILSTGGTNWQEYLPPRFQKRMFYPELWSKKEKEVWGESLGKFDVDETT